MSYFPSIIDKIWSNATRIGLSKPNMTKLSLNTLYEWFLEKGGVDQDFEAYVDMTLTYEENKNEIAKIMGWVEPEYVVEEKEKSLDELLEMVGIEPLPSEDDPYYPVVLADALRELATRLEEAEKTEDKVQVVTRDKHGKPRKVWMSTSKLVDMVGDLNRKLTKASEALFEEKRKRDEMARRLEQAERVQLKMVTVKFLREVAKFIGSDLKLYGPYRIGEVVSLPEANAAVFIDKKIAEPWSMPIPSPVTPPKPLKEKGLTTQQVRFLRAKLDVALIEELGRVPPNTSSVFIVELDKVKDKSYDEALSHIMEVSKEIVSREIAKAKPARPVERIKRAIEPYRPPLEPIGEPEEDVVFRARPAYTFPSEPLSKRRWPSRPTVQEADVLWEHFAFRLAEKGFYPDHKLYRDAFEKFFANVMFPSYSSLLKTFESLLAHIISGADIGTFVVKLAPIYEMTMPWRPDKLRYDAILFVLRWAASTNTLRLYGKPELTMEDVIVELQKYGIITDEEEIVETAKEGWKERNSFILTHDGLKMAHWFMFTAKNELENILGTSIE